MESDPIASMQSAQISIESEARKTVSKYVLYSASTGFIPVPFADIAAHITVLMKLVRKLSDIYSIPYDEGKTKSRIYALLGAVGTNTLASSFFRSLIKGIPGVGSLIGNVTMPVAAGAITYGIGQLFIKHFSSGGDLNDLPIDKFKPFFQNQIKEGLKVTKQLQEKKESPPEDIAIEPVAIEVAAIPQTTSSSKDIGRVYCILKPKLGKEGKVYLKGYYQGKRPEKYIGTIPELQKQYNVEDLSSTKEQIITDYLPIYEDFLRERYLEAEKL